MRRSIGYALSASVVAVVAAVFSGCGTSEPPRVATTIVVSPPNGLLTAVGATQQFTALVKDQHGDTLLTATVAWSTSNAAVLTVGSTGLATAVANGTAQVTATSGSASQSVNVTVSQAAASLTRVSSDPQAGTVGQALAQPLVVQVNDANAHPIQGVTVIFATASGSVGSPSAQTAANGQAQSTWTLGTVTGAQTATATVSSLAGTTVTFNATAAAGVAATVTKQAGDNQSALSGAAVTTAPAVLVKDAFGNVKPGVVVTFAIASGGGSVTKPIDTTDAAGLASVGSWTLGTAGTNTLSATVTGSGITGNPATFTATAVPATGAANVAVYVGDNQTGLVGYAVNVRPAVRVTDAGGAAVSGASVTFAVASGGGSITGATATTNSNGVAQVGSWTLGAAAATNTLTATVSGAGIVGNPVTFTASGEAASFDITVQNVGSAFSPAVQSAFDSAVAKWQRIIFRDVPDVANFTSAAGDCGSWTPAVGPVNVDDVLIVVKLDSIDGPGGTLGSAGACWLRDPGLHTVMGTMRFDTADVAALVAAGQLNQVVLHEMAHVLGFSAGRWTNPSFNCLQNPSVVGSPVDTYYNCARGLAMFDSLGGTTYTGGQKVPVENCGPASPPGCGTGTINSHWREPVLVAELMTGYLDGGVDNPLSRLTAAVMGDIGYGVNYAGADAYSQTFALRAAGASGPRFFLGGDVYDGPVYLVNAAGRVVRVLRPGARR